MIHGRFIPFAALLLALSSAHAQQPQQLKISWTNPDHPSAIYDVKSEAKLTVLVDNPTASPLPLEGEILFVTVDPLPAPIQPNAQPTFKTISVTPLTPATLAPNQRATFSLTLPFAAAGTYQLRWKQSDTSTPIENLIPNEDPASPPTPITLQCIFAPRLSEKPRSTNPWITSLPRPAALAPGYLASYIQQTSVRRFLIDERFSFDAPANVALGFGASLGTSSTQIDNFLAQAANAKASLILRIALPAVPQPSPAASPAPPDPRALAAFSSYITDAIRRSKGTLDAITIAPPPFSPAETLDARRNAYRSFYFAAYKAAKAADKNIFMIGTGTAPDTFDLLLDPAPQSPKEDNRPYLDAFAITNAADQPDLARFSLGDRKIPLWLLPPLPQNLNSAPFPPAAAGLAQNCAVVPLPSPDLDRGVTAHLLGNTSFSQRLHIIIPTAEPADPTEIPLPFIALFQGDSYTVAAIAGLSAGTDADAALPSLAQTRTSVEPLTPDPPSPSSPPIYPNLEISDDTHSMRIVNAQGDPLDTRIGDSLFAPASDHLVYLLQAGTAEDLAASLRPATPHNLPLFEVTLKKSPDPTSLTLTVKNLTPTDQSPKLRLILPTVPQPSPATSSVTQSSPAASPSDPIPQPPTTLFEKDLPPLPPNKSQEIPLDINPNTLPPNTPLVAEITTQSPKQKPQIQRTALRLN